ncbi:MAG: hypothetical protein GW886_09250 [Rhodobacterales bacterium]|nr:hypothetical protein [Rhodobacterales bacterium]NCT13309.1 hypothetical protein [Rhodobacterales bacterium]
MNGLPVVLLARMAANLRRAGRTAARDVAVMLLAGLVFVAGAGFLVAAGFGALSRALDPVVAALVMGAGLMALAGLILLARPRRRPALAPAVAAPLAAPPPLPALPQAIGPAALFVAAFVLGRNIR